MSMAVTGLITLEEAKAYLRIDGNEEDDLIARLIASSERLCLDTLRKGRTGRNGGLQNGRPFFGSLSLRAQGGCGLPQSASHPALSFVWGKEGSLLVKIGKMDKRITLLRPIPSQKTATGAFIRTMKKKGRIWAQVIQTNYAEQEAQGTPMNREQLRLKIRPRKDIRRGWRFKLSGEIYEIETVDNTYRDSTTLIVHRYEQGV
jgi:SPP1 family predicted phage head-tail adaptor